MRNCAAGAGSERWHRSRSSGVPRPPAAGPLFVPSRIPPCYRICLALSFSSWSLVLRGGPRSSLCQLLLSTLGWCLCLPEIIEVVISFCAIIGRVGTAESVRRMYLSFRAASACFLSSMNSLWCRLMHSYRVLRWRSSILRSATSPCQTLGASRSSMSVRGIRLNRERGESSAGPLFALLRCGDSSRG